MTSLETLGQTSLFAGLSSQELNIVLETAQLQTFEAGQVIFEQSSRGREVYVVMEGLVHIIDNFSAHDNPAIGDSHPSVSPRLLTPLGPGQVFGELALLDGQSRSATVVCAASPTVLMVITVSIFDQLCREHCCIGYTIMRNMATAISGKMRHAKDLFAAQVLINDNILALYEELVANASQVDPLSPLYKTMVIRDPVNFILNRFVGNAGEAGLVKKEVLEIFCFSQPAIFGRLLAAGLPGGELILQALFSLLKTGDLPEKCPPNLFSFGLKTADQRAGYLRINKQAGGPETEQYTIEWEVKGAGYSPAAESHQAALCLYIQLDTTSAPTQVIEEMLAGIAMPVQKRLAAPFAKNQGQYRVLTIHHRTPEVAHTLRALSELGYELDSFVGIPYGEASWRTIRLLDYAANHTYMALKTIQHADGPATYAFDFVQSSFLPAETEKRLQQLFALSENQREYLRAMNALALLALENSLQTCRQTGQKLIIYEDGGYLVPLLHDIYRNSGHPLHALISWALNERVIAGAIEVTTSGERRDRQALAANGGQALLPILSCARDDVKTIYEAIGVAESVVHAAANALGNLGLPTFLNRQIGVIGGNGAIGTRLVEQFSFMHRSADNVFTVDTTEEAFTQELPAGDFSYIAAKTTYLPQPRYTITEHSLPLNVDQLPASLWEIPAVNESCQLLFAEDKAYRELVIKLKNWPDATKINKLATELAGYYGYQAGEGQPLPREAGLTWNLTRGESSRRLVLLAPRVVLNFKSLSLLLKGGVSTLVGITGQPVFSARDFDTFLRRQVAPGQLDELVLISGSSKDTEFQHLLKLFDRLLQLFSNTPPALAVQQEWLTAMYYDNLSFMQGSGMEALTETTSKYQENNPLKLRQVIERVKSRFSIRKERHPDIGSIYYLTFDGVTKRVVLVADGFVVNFFARHEKGVKTEYMDPIMSMQLLGILRLSQPEQALPSALLSLKENLCAADKQALWEYLDIQSQPPRFI